MRLKSIAVVFFILTIFSNLSVAQELDQVMRYEFQMTYRPEIQSKQTKVETTYLDVWEHNSRFASAQRVKFIEFISDPANAVYRFESVANAKHPKGSNWVIQKENRTIYDYSMVGSSYFKTAISQDAISWDIDPEVSDYQGMKVQKANAQWGGRFWTVWFTQEINLIEGPYVFKNLPGFVVKASSGDGDYLYEFIKSQKAQTVLNYSNFESAALITKPELKKARVLAAQKSLKQTLAEQGIEIHTEFNPELEQDLAKKVGDQNNYIDIL